MTGVDSRKGVIGILTGGGDVPGLVLRPFDPAADYPDLVDLIREAHLADHVDYLPTEEALRTTYEHLPEFDPRRPADIHPAATLDTRVPHLEPYHVRQRQMQLRDVLHGDDPQVPGSRTQPGRPPPPRVDHAG